MRQFPISDEFKDEFRHAVRRYFKEVEDAKKRARKVEAYGKPAPLNSWRYDLASALQLRAWDRVSDAESQVCKLIRSLNEGKPVPAVECFNNSIEPNEAFPAVEALGFVFTLTGEDQNFVVRPVWMQVKVE